MTADCDQAGKAGADSAMRLPKQAWARRLQEYRPDLVPLVIQGRLSPAMAEKAAAAWKPVKDVEAEIKTNRKPWCYWRVKGVKYDGVHLPECVGENCSTYEEAALLLTKLKKAGFKNVTVDVVHNTDPRPDGNSVCAALRRLRKHRPDLRSLVLSGELSPHAAAVEAGFRDRTATFPLEPTKLAKAIIRRLGREGTRELVAEIQNQLD